MASFWKYTTKIDFLQNELLTDFLSADLSALSRDYDIFINMFSIACITAFLKMRRPHSRIFGYPLILGFLFYGLRDYLPVALKVISWIIVNFFCWYYEKMSILCHYLFFSDLSDDFIFRLLHCIVVEEEGSLCEI